MQTAPLVFSLRSPEQAEWRGDSLYNSAIHARLLDASKRILESTPESDHRPRVERLLLRLLGRRMSRRQEMLLYYLLAQCGRAHDLSRTTNFVRALEWVSRSEEIAGALQDYGAQVDIHELRGTLHRAVAMYRVAAEEFSLALHEMREHTRDHASFDPEFEVTLAGKAAVMDYLIGATSHALEHLQQAALLLPLAEIGIAGRGTIEWNFALLDRQRNETDQALWHVGVAVELYRQLGAINSTCRVLSLAADIALDAVESPSDLDPATRAEYLTQAARYVEEAIDVGRQARDIPGLALASLSRARVERLRDHAPFAEIKARIDAALRQAREIEDESLQAAAETALGLELLAAGQRRRGKLWLGKAIATATRAHAPGLAVRARRALRMAEGRNA